MSGHDCDAQVPLTWMQEAEALHQSHSSCVGACTQAKQLVYELHWEAASTAAAAAMPAATVAAAANASSARAFVKSAAIA